MDFLASSMKGVVEAIEAEVMLLRAEAVRLEAESLGHPPNSQERRNAQAKRVAALAESFGKAQAAHRMSVVLTLYTENKMKGRPV